MRTIVLALALLSCVPPDLRPPAPRIEVEQARAAAIVESVCDDASAADSIYLDGSSPFLAPSIGSGVVTTDRTVLTAAHVVRCQDFPLVHVTLTSGRRLTVVVTKIDEDADLARLEIMSADRFWQGLPPALLALDRGPSLACALVAYPVRRRACGELIGDVLSVDLPPGSSGAGVYDARGEFVGVVTDSVTYAVGSRGTRVAFVSADWLR